MNEPSTTTINAGSTHHRSQRIGPWIRVRPSPAGSRFAGTALTAVASARTPGPLTRPSWIRSRSDAQLVRELLDRRRRALERRRLLGGQRDLQDLLDPAPPELHRHPHEEPLDPVLALQVRRARQDLPLVLQDGLDHLDDRRGRGVVRAPGPEEV